MIIKSFSLQLTRILNEHYTMVRRLDDSNDSLMTVSSSADNEYWTSLNEVIQGLFPSRRSLR